MIKNLNDDIALYQKRQLKKSKTDLLTKPISKNSSVIYLSKNKVVLVSDNLSVSKSSNKDSSCFHKCPLDISQDESFSTQKSISFFNLGDSILSGSPKDKSHSYVGSDQVSDCDIDDLDSDIEEFFEDDSNIEESFNMSVEDEATALKYE